LTLELLIGQNNYADRASATVRRISHNMLESLEFEVVNPDLGEVSPGGEVMLLEDEEPVFEGIIYQREIRRERGLTRAKCLAYSYLISYDRHIVFRLYRPGTYAGEIIRELAQLEKDVDTTDVADGEQLVTDWPIENVSALEVMRDTARGVNFLLLMKPGKRLIFRPKTAKTPLGTITENEVRRAELLEDKWRMRNRIIYVGSDGEVLAECSEEPGDSPLVVHDPFLTSRAEAERRARTRLMMEKERGLSLKLEVASETFRTIGIDIGETLTINLPSLGLLEKEMVVLGIEYQPSISERTRTVVLGGVREYLEEFLDELMRGETTSRFGHRLSAAEALSDVSALVSTVMMAQKLQADTRTIRIINKPPLVLENPTNIVLDENGEACLAAGYTSGSFEFSYTPQSSLFTRWLRTHYLCRENKGEVKVELLKSDGKVVEQDLPPDYEFRYLPKVPGELTSDESLWISENAAVTRSALSIVSGRSIMANRTGPGVMRLIYPSSRLLGWRLSGMKMFRLYLYSMNDGYVTVRLHQSSQNYLTANLRVHAGVWTRSETYLTDADIETLNWINLESELPTLNIDSDFLLIPAVNEKITMRFTLSRMSPTDESPRVGLVKIVWREGG